jgi:hypothetical protein
VAEVEAARRRGREPRRPRRHALGRRVTRSAAPRARPRRVAAARVRRPRVPGPTR